jgi:hypothetical protein
VVEAFAEAVGVAWLEIAEVGEVALDLALWGGGV